MAKMNFKDALNKSLQVAKQYIDEETKLDNVLDLKRTASIFGEGEIILDENGFYDFENGKLFYNLYNKDPEIKINLNNTISDKEYLLNINDLENCHYYKEIDGTEEFYFQIYDDEIDGTVVIGLMYYIEDVSHSLLTVYSVCENEVQMTVNSFEIVTFEYESKIQSKMIENVDYEKIINKPYPIISVEDYTNIAIPFTDWVRFNKYNLIDRRTTDINNTPYENSTGNNNTVEGSLNEINPIGTGIRIWNTAASGMENAKGLKFNIPQELVNEVNAGFIIFSCTFEAVNRPTRVRLVAPNGLYNEDLIPFTKSHSGASTTGTFRLSFKTTEGYSYELLAGDYYILFAVDDPEGADNCLIDLSNIVVYIDCLNDEDQIKVTRDIDKFIERDNKIPYEPTTDYSPATKKYVDSHQAILDFPGVDASSAGITKGIFIDVENLQVNTFYKMPAGKQRILFRKNGTGNFEIRSGPYAFASIFYVQTNNDTNTVIMEQGPVLVRNNINWTNGTLTVQVINVNLEYEPTSDYHPATKKYVDDSIAQASIDGEVDTTKFALKSELFSKDYNDLINKPTIPSINGLATETYVNNAVSGIVDSAPETLNTLNELAQALGDDPNFATTIVNQIGQKADASVLNNYALKTEIPTVTNDLTNVLKANYDAAYTHSQSAHAPSNAQKNSDITKAEIEAKLTGTITSHDHGDTYAPASHGVHVPTPQAVSYTKFLRNDNTWQDVTPANIGAATAGQLTTTNTNIGTLSNLETSVKTSLVDATNELYQSLNTHNHGLLHDNHTVEMENTTTDNGWSMINSSYNGFILKSIRTNTSAPNWICDGYASGVAFGGGDTKGVLSCAYNSPSIKIAGGNGTAPVWWVGLTGTSGTTYDLNGINTAYTHSQAAHAPTDAQKNSDITKAEIEAKLTGNIESHTHNQYLTEVPSNYATQDYVNNKLANLQLVQITKTEYDALTTKDPNTLYLIIG